MNFLVYSAKARYFLFMLSLFFMGWSDLIAQEEKRPKSAIDLTRGDQTKSEEFDIVITGTKKEMIYKEAPVATRVVSKKQMESRGDTNLYQALRATTGVVPQNNCQNCNFDGVRLNGLDSKYNQILINGIPLVSPLAEVYFYASFPEVLINRVEVVKGGGSALYGGGAVGGVINILMTKPKANQAEIGYQHSYINGETPDGYAHFLSSRVSEDGSKGLSTFGSITYAKPYDHNGDGFSEISQKRGASVGAAGYVSPFDNAELTYMLLYNRDDRNGGNAFNKEQMQAGVREGVSADFYLGLVKWDQRFSERFAYSIYSSASYVERRAYYGANEEYDLNAGGLDANNPARWGSGDTFIKGYSRTENPLSVNGLDLTFTMVKGHEILVGASYLYEKLDDKITGTGVRNLSEYADFGAYVQYDGRFFKILQLVVGLRVDRHSEIEDLIVSPRANLLVHILDNLQWRLAYTTGFSPPRIFVEDFHLTVIDGDAQHIQNINGLKAETSRSYSSSLSWQIRALGLNVDIAPGFFYTQLKDAFTLEKDDPTSDIYMRKNSEGATVIGGELDIRLRKKNLDLSLGFSMQKSAFDKAQTVLGDDGSGQPVLEKQMLRAPKATGNLAVMYDLHPFSVSTDLIVYGSMKTVHETPADGSNPGIKTTPVFYEWGLRFAVEFYHSGSNQWEIFAGVKNILNQFQDDLDKGYGRDAGYVYGPSLPRTIYVGLKGKL